MDGARFANALVSLDVSPAEMTWKSGVDVLTLGGTKNGCLAAEAIIFFKPEMVGDFPFLHKRSGQLLSKMRFISSQMNAYVSDDVWIKNAKHANAMAKILSEGLNHFSNIELAYPTESNEVFVHLPRDVIDYLNSSGYDVNEEELDGKAVRFVTAWDTKVEDVENLLEKLAQKYQ
jgi:threonine aldolase